jgi:hypothetical protein
VAEELIAGDSEEMLTEEGVSNRGLILVGASSERGSGARA